MVQFFSNTKAALNTRKLIYRKDKRAMCPIYECPENNIM